MLTRQSYIISEVGIIIQKKIDSLIAILFMEIILMHIAIISQL